MAAGVNCLTTHPEMLFTELANPHFKKELNRQRIPEYLCFEYIPSNETLFKNVYKMPPASYFICKDGKITVFINGKLRNEGTSVNKSGHIGLQSEGGTVLFRNVNLLNLKD